MARDEEKNTMQDAMPRYDWRRDLIRERERAVDYEIKKIYSKYDTVDDSVALGTFFASAAWILKYVSRYLNEHALMVASFFRVNAKRLENGEPALLDLGKFVQMCRNDIANGANPPPEPPAPEPPAEMEPAYDGEPYSPFSPGKLERQQREAKERRRLAELRARREARDPLLEGLDYPETYASASDAY